ncbi:MAG: type VI secretion system baseplate subunit TssG [Myxococcota bacterium]
MDDSEEIRRDLLSHATSYDFFYTVGMMERLEPQAVRVGGNGPYEREAIRFRHDPSLAFKAGDIMDVAWVPKPQAAEDALQGKQHRFELTTAFMGLTGSVSPLPLYVAEEVAQAQDTAPVKRDFLDMFHHRLISFVYRIGVKHDLAREYMKDASDPWSRRILAMAGFDSWGGHATKAIPTWRILRLAPLLSSGVRSARTLEIAIEDVCGHALRGATVHIETFAGGWTPLDAEQRMALGANNHQLGQSSVLGQQCFDKGGKAVIVIGPLGQNFRQFLADGDQFPVIVELLALLTDEPIVFEMRLDVRDDARPPFKLGISGARIGVDSWLGSGAQSAAMTHVKVELPRHLDRPPNNANYGWQSQPQRV